ncbi:MAG: DUF177 domain-containing protein [Lachnospiraceae bacterium]|nr:DUF177 domain-containing protein [Lachnospiraceae bacterium]
MLINLSELFPVEGKEKTYAVDLEMDAFSAPDGVYKVVSKGPVALRIQNLGGKRLLMEGEARIVLAIPCSRCLDPVDSLFELHICQELDLSNGEEGCKEYLDEQPYVIGFHLDVDQLIGNELLLNLPMKVVCREDCKGICNRCGTNLNYHNCSCSRNVPDPRMSAIQDLFQQFKEV